MSVPTNTSFGTATDLGSLPASVVQTVDDSGTTYTVYYKFTAPAGVTVVGAWGFGDLTTYQPTIVPYDSTQTQILSITVANKPIQFTVTAGELYYLEFTPNGGNPSPAVLTLSVLKGPTFAVPVGSIAVNDDTVGFPLALLSSTADNTVLTFVSPFAAGEAGDTLADGTVLVQNIDTNSADRYNSAYQLLSSTAITGNLRMRTCLTPQVFYVGTSTNPATYRTITGAGVVSSAHNLTAHTSLAALASNNAETILYHADFGNNKAINRWDTVNHVALTDLAVGIANYTCGDILYTTNDLIVVGYYKTTATTDYQVLVYDTAGSTVHTFNYGSWVSSQPRLAYAIDDPMSFWVFLHPAATVGVSQFVNTKISDGSAITSHVSTEYEHGIYKAAATATPTARFGNSFSCPFWITRVAASPVTETFPIRRQRRFLLPSSDSNFKMNIPDIEILMRTGIGLLPDSWTPGTATPLGADPQVMFRMSKDGGETWTNERWISAGPRGKRDLRVRLVRATGDYRNGVLEVTVDAPVDWQFVAALGNPREGTS